MNSKTSIFMNFYKFVCTVDEEDFCQKVAAYRLRTWSSLPLDSSRFVVFDTETTGFYPQKGDEIISVGGVVIDNGQLTDETFLQFINPNREIPPLVTELTGITDEMVATAPDFLEVCNKFMDFVGSSMLVAHCGAFDFSFINPQLQKNCGEKLCPLVLDTFLLSNLLFPDRTTHSLEDLAETYGITISDRHTALGDSIITGNIFLAMVEDLKAKGIRTTTDLLYSFKYLKFSTQ
ncbi:MAG: exonuclease domain-containing protein [Desulfosporosinus sp.]|nr:exonuclease domain-containing protein [Desulfosporosinus sp.]